MKVRLLFWLFVPLLVVMSLYAVYAAKAMSDFQSLLMCANEDMSIPLVPANVCEYYFANIHDEQSDIAYLNESIGVGWALVSERRYYNESLMNTMLDKGVSIDAVDRHSGLNALHAKVLESDPVGVRILLQRGADRNLPSRPVGSADDHEARTPLELALFLYERDQSPELAEIVRLLNSGES